MCWSYSWFLADEIDRINILQASLKAMHQAVPICLCKKPLWYWLMEINYCRILLWKTNRHYQRWWSLSSIAAASILAKTHRDEFISGLSEEYPQYGWEQNKAYLTIYHIDEWFASTASVPITAKPTVCHMPEQNTKLSTHRYYLMAYPVSDLTVARYLSAMGSWLPSWRR